MSVKELWDFDKDAGKFPRIGQEMKDIKKDKHIFDSQANLLAIIENAKNSIW